MWSFRVNFVADIGCGDCITLGCLTSTVGITKHRDIIVWIYNKPTRTCRAIKCVFVEIAVSKCYIGSALPVVYNKSRLKKN